MIDNLGKPKIDSLRIHIPMDKVKVTHKTTFLDSMLTVSQDTGVVDSEHIQTTHFDRVDGIATSYARRKLLKGSLGEVDCLIIGFSAKLLKGEYFDGITKDNISTIFTYIQDEGVVEFSFSTFINAHQVDADICVDYHLGADIECKDVVKIASQLSIKHRETNANLFTLATNVGIEWGNRKTVGKAYKTKQYLKYYDKHTELKYNSSDFYNKYIKDRLRADAPHIKEHNLLRVETTIKNNAHWETYGIQARTLQDLLLINLEDNMQIFKRPISHYMTGEKAIPIKTKKNYTDEVQIIAIEMTMDALGVDSEKAIEYILNRATKNKTDRSTKKRRLNELYQGTLLTKGMKKTDALQVAKQFKLIPDSL
jgi:hypothetical protein